jgi:3-vinyl bacteriochlorophyllide hydratase
MAPQATSGVLKRRSRSLWTTVHPIFAIGQLLVFLVSVSLLIAYFFGAVSYHVVHISVLIKIALMVGALVTGALWEKDVYNYWWFAPEFITEDVMTLLVFVSQMAYLAMYYTHQSDPRSALLLLCLAYAIYLANVAQYIHRTQQMKKDNIALKEAA